MTYLIVIIDFIQPSDTVGFNNGSSCKVTLDKHLNLVNVQKIK